MTFMTYPGTPLPTRSSWLRRLTVNSAAAAAGAWHAWREAARLRRAEQALYALSDETLRDIGMGEFSAARARTLAESDFLRGL